MTNKTNFNLWKAEYLLDIEDIDKQHQYFFEICNKIVNLCDVARSGKEVSAGRLMVTILELRSYAFNHFGTEESLFIKYKYPNMFNHMDLHDHYVKKINLFTQRIKRYYEMSEKQVTDEFLEEARAISEFAVEWWSSHIMQEDTQYAILIKDKCKIIVEN